MSTAPFHKHDEMDDLLALASDVLASPPCQRVQLSARDAARALVGIVSWVSRLAGTEHMQDCMRKIVRHADAWRPDVNMRDLPTEIDGRADQYVAMIAVVVSSLLPLFGAQSLRAAMAFWGTERDAHVWQEVAA